MPKKADPNILSDAYFALFVEYDSYDTTEIIRSIETEMQNPVILKSNIPSAESLFQRKEMYEKLSPEAKEVISTILFSPDEILQFLKQKRITKRAVRLYFTKQWMSKWIAENTVKELTRWANQL